MKADPIDAHGGVRLARALLACLEVQAKVIPDPSLPLDHCGLPRSLASRLFAPRLASAAPLDASLAPVLLSRRNPPDLRAIQAFFPRLREGSALHLAPAAMQRIRVTPGAFVRIRAPFSSRATQDARQLLADPAALSSVDGRPALLLSEDARLGLAHLCWFEPQAPGGLEIPLNPSDAWPHGLGLPVPPDPSLPWYPWRWNALGPEVIQGLLRWQLVRGHGLRGVYPSAAEALESLQRGEVSPHALVVVRSGGPWFATTPGQLSVAQALGVPAPELEPLGEFSLRPLRALAAALASRRIDRTAASERLERLGLDAVTRAGFSLCSDSFRAPPARPQIFRELFARILEVEHIHREGLTTDGERYCKIIDLWSEAQSRCSTSAPHPDWTTRPLSLLLRAGLVERASLQKIHTMVGLHGKPSGEIIEVGCERGWADGLRPHDYVKSCAENRCARVARLLWRWRRGSLWGALVRSLGPVKVVEEDCGSPGSMAVEALRIDPWNELISLQDRLEGRTLVVEPREGRGARIRSPLTCEARGGVCVACHGAGPGRRGAPAPGDAVGLWAADAVASRAHRFASRVFHPVGREFPGGFPELQSLLMLRQPPYRGRFTGRYGASELPCELDVARRAQLVSRGEMAVWLVDEILAFFAFQGLFLAPVHAELVAAQMLDFVRIVQPGDALWGAGQVVRRSLFFRANAALTRGGGRPALAEPAVVGVGQRCHRQPR
ncbi:MAG: hypothetical protein MUF64_08705 [Polyangiaceae bacterium]|jgi:hypothetical protein|nr:hypothetical protein [Polyangiaceae bacterium]